MVFRVRKWPLLVFAQTSYSSVDVSRVRSGCLSWFLDQRRKTDELRSMHEFSEGAMGPSLGLEETRGGWVRLTHSFP